MTRFAAFGALLAAILISSPLSAAQSCRICGHPEYPPFMWNHQGQVLGLGKQLLTAALQPQDVALDTHFEGNWKRCLAALKVGSVDFVVAAYLTDERRDFMEYSAIPVSADPVYLFLWHRRPVKFRLWSDLEGKSMVALHGDSHGQRFDAFARESLQITEVNQVRQAFKMLETGRVDFIVGGLQPWKLRSTVHGYQGRILSSDQMIEMQQLYIAVSKRSPCRSLLPQINRYLEDNAVGPGYQQALQQAFDLYLQQSSGKSDRKAN